MRRLGSVPHVLCFLHSFEPGGVERTALRLCGAWHEAGVDVTIMLGRDEGALHAERPGCPYLVPYRPRFSTAPFETAWMIAQLPAMIRRSRPDLLYCSGNSYTVVAVAMKLLLGRDCPPIIAKISNDLARPDLSLPIRAMYRLWCRIQAYCLDHLIALSPAMRDEILAIMRARPERVSVIANPVLDHGRRRALAEAGRTARRTSGTGRRFLAIGRLVPQKDFALLIRAFALGAGPDDRLVIVGEGPERRRLERLIRASTLHDRVRLAGHSDRIERWIARSDILLLSSRYEGLPGAVVEALAAGLGVVATDCCTSMAALLNHGRFGTLVPPRSLSALADAIAGTAPGQADWQAAAEFAATFDVSATVTGYRNLFDRILPTPIIGAALRDPDRKAA